MEARFSASVQTGPGVQPAYYTMGTGSFPGLKRPGRGVDHPPPSSAEVKGRVELYLYSPFGPSWPAIGWPLSLLPDDTTGTETCWRLFQCRSNVTVWVQILRVRWLMLHIKKNPYACLNIILQTHESLNQRWVRTAQLDKRYCYLIIWRLTATICVVPHS